MSWLERCSEGDQIVYGRGASWVLGYDDCGDFRVPSIRQRIKRGEPWWVKRYNPRNPWHWLFYAWSRVRGGVAWVEGQ